MKQQDNNSYLFRDRGGGKNMKNNKLIIKEASVLLIISMIAISSIGVAANSTAKNTCSSASYADIEITIGGGFGVSAIIKNVGTTDLKNINWSFALDGDYIFFGQNKTGTIKSLDAGASITVRDFLVFGVGETGIIVKAGDAQANATGTVLVFFVLDVTS
jgi:hypothetical protein